jgi:hypothetical protein
MRVAVKGGYAIGSAFPVPAKRCFATPMAMAARRTAVVAFTVLSMIPSMAFAASDITTSTIDGGGRRTSSANYTMDGSVGGIGGISSALSDAAKNGYIGQLTEVASVIVTSTPSAINEGSTSQLSGAATLDDDSVTALSGNDILWAAVAYPLQSIDSNGLVTAMASVYSAPLGTISGSYLGATATTSVQVLGPYANSGIDDAWQVTYFGQPPNANAAPDADADDTGQNNLFKYVAGLDPTNPSSVFVLKVASVAGQPTQKNLIFTPEVSGRTYTPQFRTSLTGGGWATLTGTGAPVTNVNQVTVTDLAATQTNKFYRIDISLP